MLVIYFGNCTVHNTVHEAFDKAHMREDEIFNSECPILEYGVSNIKIDKVFPSMGREEAEEIECKRWADKVI